MDQRDDQKQQAPQTSKKKYESPRLVYLGAVRDLTASGGTSVTDTVVSKRSSM